MLIEPPFWQDYLSDVPLCVELVSNYHKIRKEVLEFIQLPNSLLPYPNYNIYGHDETSKIPLYERSWLAIPFSSSVNEFASEASGSSHELSIKLVAAFVRESCPTLVKAINHLECSSYLANGFISKLVPGTVINPHRGRSNDFMRIHLGIDCDPNCRITVGTESQSWKDGSLLAFKDGGPYLHSVRHSGIKDRVIISCDVSLHYLSNFSIDLKLSQH